jgi:hypothetical protein
MHGQNKLHMQNMAGEIAVWETIAKEKWIVVTMAVEK